MMVSRDYGSLNRFGQRSCACIVAATQAHAAAERHSTCPRVRQMGKCTASIICSNTSWVSQLHKATKSTRIHSRTAEAIVVGHKAIRVIKYRHRTD